MNMRILLPVICLQLCGCMENHKITAVATDRADSNVQVMEKSQTSKAIETANKKDAVVPDAADRDHIPDLSRHLVFFLILPEQIRQCFYHASDHPPFLWC